MIRASFELFRAFSSIDLPPIDLAAEMYRPQGVIERSVSERVQQVCQKLDILKLGDQGQRIEEAYLMARNFFLKNETVDQQLINVRERLEEFPDDVSLGEVINYLDTLSIDGKLFRDFFGFVDKHSLENPTFSGNDVINLVKQALDQHFWNYSYYILSEYTELGMDRLTILFEDPNGYDYLSQYFTCELARIEASRKKNPNLDLADSIYSFLEFELFFLKLSKSDIAAFFENYDQAEAFKKFKTEILKRLKTKISSQSL